jgi:hypothetical protein
LTAWWVGWLVDWLVGCLAGWLVGWLVGWLAGCLVGWVVGWLVGWMACVWLASGVHLSVKDSLGFCWGNLVDTHVYGTVISALHQIISCTIADQRVQTFDPMPEIKQDVAEKRTALLRRKLLPLPSTRCRSGI